MKHTIEWVEGKAHDVNVCGGESTLDDHSLVPTLHHGFVPPVVDMDHDFDSRIASTGASDSGVQELGCLIVA